MPGNVPPSTSGSVLAVADSIVIDAPVEKVWETLLDFSSYPEWNSFVRYQALVDHKNKPLEDQSPREGGLLYLKAHLPPSMEPRMFAGSSSPVISHLDHENHRAAWTQRDDWSAYFLRFERWQWLTVIEAEGGIRTKYDSLEVFNGPLAYFVKWFVGGSLRAGVKAMAEDLKRRVEHTG